MRDTTTQNLPPGDQVLLRKPKRLDGISVLRARLHRFAYKKHSHREFAIGLIEKGVQKFYHSGGQQLATPKTILTINPGEVHDGRSATRAGYRYRMVYIDPKQADNRTIQV